MSAWQWAAALAPLAAIQITLMIIALVDLARRNRVRGGSKAVWALVIVAVNILGPSLYLLWGREDGIDRFGN